MTDAGAPKLPIRGQRNIPITSALPYVNNVPHLGNIIGCVLVRMCSRGTAGFEVTIRYMCEGLMSMGRQLRQKLWRRSARLKKSVTNTTQFTNSFDHFGRTSTPQQTEVCHAIFQKLLDNNWLSENTMQQLYCDTCKKFLAEQLVEDVCPTPSCDYESARGDQCEKCGKLLNPTELKEPKCKVCHNTPQIRDTNHLFLELLLLRDKVEMYINEMSVAGGWSQNAIQTTHA